MLNTERAKPTSNNTKSGKELLRDTYLNGLNQLIEHEKQQNPDMHTIRGRETEEVKHVFDLQFEHLIKDMIESGEDILKPEQCHIDFLFEPIEDWLRYARNKKITSDNRRYEKILRGIALEDLARWVANSFHKKHKWLPYQIITKEDLYQEAYLALMLARENYDPQKGKMEPFFFTSIFNHFFNLYQEANAKQRLPDNYKNQVKYKPAHTERYIESNMITVQIENGYHEKDRPLIKKRFKSKEHTQHYDEERYFDPPRIEQRDNLDYQHHEVNGQSFIIKARHSGEGNRRYEYRGRPLGYGKKQLVFRHQAFPANVYEMQISSTNKLYKFGGGYLDRQINYKERGELQGIGYDGKKGLLEGYPKQNKRQFSTDGFKVEHLPPGIHDFDKPTPNVIRYKGKPLIIERMKNADPLLPDTGSGVPDFWRLKQEAWQVINTFPEQQRQFFELFYGEDGIKICRDIIKLQFPQTIEDDFFVICIPIAGSITTGLGYERIEYDIKTLKDAARVMKTRDQNIKPLHDDGIGRLQKHLVGVYGCNIIRDTTDKRIKNKYYYFKTNFQVRELLKK